MTAALLADPVIDLVLRGALAALFAAAALHKLRDVAAFRDVVRAYRLLPDAAVGAAPAIAVGELGVAAALLAPPTRTTGVLGALALLAVYTIAIAVNLGRGRRTIDCGCGPLGARQPISERLLARNASLMVAAAFAMRTPAARGLVWIDWVTIAGGVGALSCAWSAAHSLAGAAAIRARGAEVAR